MKTIKDLLKEYDLDLEAPDYVLNYVIGEDDDEFGEYHQEEQGGNIIHVFENKGEIIDEINGEEIKETLIIECILDLNNTPSWREFRRFEGDEESSCSGIMFNEDGTTTDIIC